ncbi:4-hydroxy-tetrahydrodipicolinate reductase [Roseivirga sp. BDSF3-8]|uniref:4-hydroxy-tetrahydrodipicolinate reductase n=1 Tax=Roseivirga sp. BDSF3-8 TaxID=3241598 RepID=UPI00353230B2
MNILLIGYGKMGHAIEEIAKERGHTITGALNSEEERNAWKGEADVAIEFSQPDAAFDNIHFAIERGIPVVSGTTGWLERQHDVATLCEKHNGAFFYASNYSIGVNIFFRVNRYLADIMGQQEGYDVEMEEVHHTEKKDAPSGTAITLAEDIIERVKQKSRWVNETTEEKDALGISSLRIDKTPGTHTVTYSSDIDSIEIKHTAHSRKGFALGAVVAAEWLSGRQGVFGMDDMLPF